MRYGFNDIENLLLGQIQIVCFGRGNELTARNTYFFISFSSLFGHNSNKHPKFRDNHKIVAIKSRQLLALTEYRMLP
jgi:hypothetical protein